MIDLFEDCNFFTNPITSAPTKGIDSLYLVDKLSAISLAFVAVESGQTFPFWVPVDYLDCLDISINS
jgi:hypothetical protein